ncbi:MAG: hypothetical protein ACMXX9_01290 [Candidatus Woesearchaeota archaeon]
MSAKKKEVKKTVKKRKVSKPKILSNAPATKYFLLVSGESVKSVKELADVLEDHNDAFKHHVTGDRNDFADWVEHVFNSKKLANSLRESKSLTKTRLEIYKYLAENKR